MTTPRLLLVNSDRLTVYHRERDFIAVELECCNDQEGLDGLATLIEKDRNRPNTILLDLVEEEFRVEKTPWLLFGRKDLFAATASRLFRQARRRHWRILGRESEGRRDARVLFTAITNEAPLKPWLTILHRLKAPLIAIRSVPLLSAHLIKPLAITAPLALLVSEQRGGLRHTFFRNGLPTISRLAPGYGDNTLGDYVDFVRDEISKTRRYLQRLQLLPPGADLDIYLFNSPGILEAVVASGPIDEGVRLHPLPLPEAAAALKCRWPIEEEYRADSLFALLALKHRGNDYATAADRRYATHRQWRIGLDLAALLLLAGAIAESGALVIDAYTLQQQREALVLNRARYQQLYNQEITASLPTDLDPGLIKDRVLAADYLAGVAADPRQILTELSRVMSDYPEFKINELRWRADGFHLGTDGKTTTGRLSADDQTTTQGLRQVLEVSGAIALKQDAVRPAFEHFNQLTAELPRRITRFDHLEVVAAPFDLSPAGTIRRTQTAKEKPPSFAFRLVTNLGPESRPKRTNDKEQP